MKRSSVALGVAAAAGGAVVALGGVGAWHALAQPGPASGYGAQGGYAAQPAYGAQPGYGAQPSYGAQPGYAPQPGYGSGPGYPAQGAPSGGVTLAQFQAHMRTRLMRADTDHDGRISLAEWTAWRTAHPGHGGGQDPAKGFARMDLNGDGYITPDEIDAVAARRFARIDANHDGVLSPQERAAGRPGGGGEADGGEGAVQPLNPQ